ncbi:MAG: CinA family protein [Nitrospirae bacterium]|nr:CinA family protein [Nitrospirota bacterium]MBF0540739.1 CinA family protein [Nitrospirota bacterium]
MIDKIINICSSRGLTIGLAESCTGGMISEMITSVSGSSKVFKGAIVSYSDNIKESLLDVSKETLITYGAVSEETAREMVLGCRKKLLTDICVSVTGIAGPTGGSVEKPVGLVYIGLLVGRNIPLLRKYKFNGNRDEIRRQSAAAVIKLIYEALSI